MDFNEFFNDHGQYILIILVMIAIIFGYIYFQNKRSKQ